jgi:hypothetical protein
MSDNPEYKKAVIDWLLSVGESATSTYYDLAHLAVHGVNYEASDMPDMGTAMVDPGDSDTEAKFANVFTARIYANDEDPNDFRSGTEFYIAEDAMNRLVLGFVIKAVVTSASDGDSAWKSHLDTPAGRIYLDRARAEKERHDQWQAARNG